MKVKGNKKHITIVNLAEMPYDKHGCHATGRRIYANDLVFDEYEDEEGNLFYM